MKGLYENTQANETLQKARTPSKQEYQARTKDALYSSLGPVARGARAVELTRRPSLAKDDPSSQFNLDYVEAHSTAVRMERIQMDNPAVKRAKSSIDDVVGGPNRAKSNLGNYRAKKESYAERYSNSYSYAGRERKAEEDKRSAVYGTREVADAFKKLREGVKEEYKVDFKPAVEKPKYGGKEDYRIVGTLDDAVKIAA
tara:strand:- start:54 stop:650 length:597 start_codon:yes stop_codon:yes gene_type:complete